MSTPKRWGENYQRFPEAILMLLLGLPPIIGGVTLSERLQEAQCPWETFLTGPLHPDFQIGVIFAASALWYGVARHFILHKIPILRVWLKVDLSCDQRWHERWGGIAAIALVIVLAGFYVVVRAQYCLTLSNIMHRPLFSDAYRVLAWNDVVEIDLGCWKGNKGSTEHSYELVTHDGTRLEILGSNEGFDWGYSYLRQVLEGVKYRVDTSRVRKDWAPCQNPV